MPLAQRDGHQILRVAANALDLVESGAGADEGKRAALQLFQLLPPECQTEPVHRYHVQAHIGDLKEGAGVDRAALIGGDSKRHLFNHAPQHLLLHGNGILIFHFRKIRVICGGQAQNVEVRIAAGDVNHHLLVCRKGDHVVGHPADDVAKQAGVQHNVAALHHVGKHVGADAGLHIVAGDGQLLIRMEQQALQSRNEAFLSHGAAGDSDGVLQKNLFTGKFDHRAASFLFHMEG